MTSHDDGQRDEPAGHPGRAADPPDDPCDEDAAWRRSSRTTASAPRWATTPPPPSRRRPFGGTSCGSPADPAFDRSYLDAVDAPRPGRARTAPRRRALRPTGAAAAPAGTPARRLAWAGLFGPPLLMMLAVVLGWTYPPWFLMLLVAAFVGGFVFLVATMPRDRGEDGDDGAVV